MFTEKPWSQGRFPREAVGQPCRASLPRSPQEKGQACLARLGAIYPGFKAWMGQCFSNRDWEQMALLPPEVRTPFLPKEEFGHLCLVGPHSLPPLQGSALPPFLLDAREQLS